MSITLSMTQSIAVEKIMDYPDMSITSFMSQPSAVNNLMDRHKSITFRMAQPTAVEKLMGFHDFSENHLEKIKDKIKAHTILTNYKPKQLSFQSLMKPTGQRQLQMTPPLEVLMKFSFEEPKELMNAPMSICGESLNETGGYKMAILAALIGASRVSTRFPAARKIAIIAGITINTIAVMYAIYNCKLHWNEEEGGKQKLNKVQSLISKLLSVCKKKFLATTLERETSYIQTKRRSG